MRTINKLGWREHRRDARRPTAQWKRAQIRKRKDRPCADCGRRFPYYVMEFDHREPSSKRFNIAGSFTRSWEALQNELVLCDVVCSNCHRIRTHTHRQTDQIRVGRPRKTA